MDIEVRIGIYNMCERTGMGTDTYKEKSEPSRLQIFGILW